MLLGGGLSLEVRTTFQECQYGENRKAASFLNIHHFLGGNEGLKNVLCWLCNRSVLEMTVYVYASQDTDL